MKRRTKLAIGILAVAGAIVAMGVYVWEPAKDTSAQASYLAGDLSGTLAQLSQQGEVDVDSVLLAANCYRQLGKISACTEYAEQAQAVDEAKAAADLVMAMLRIQNGQLDSDAAALIEVLVSGGADDAEARAVVVSGLLANERFDEAADLLEQWQAAAPDSADRLHLTAVLANLSDRPTEAEELWLETIRLYPRFELAWLALADFYSRPPNVRFAKAELVLGEVAGRFPNNAEARVKLSRIQRRLGHAEKSQLAELPPNATDAEILETAAVQFDSGDFAASLGSLEPLRLVTAEDFNQLTDTAFSLALRGNEELGAQLSERVSRAATALALSGQPKEANIVFDTAIDRQARLKRLTDLNVRQSVSPDRQDLIDESNAMVSPAYAPNYPTMQQLAGPAEPTTNLAGFTLYESRCAQCHGTTGDGFGVAAVNMFPAPRSFQKEPFRLVSGSDGSATDEDLERTIRNGEPGTSMPAFPDLSASDIAELINVLRGFQRSAQRAPQLQGDQPRSISPPAINASAEAVGRGRQAFASAGCGGCHAVDAEPFSQPPLFDSMGRPLRAPNLALNPFHGGDAGTELYKRIVLGIPGTPHPALVAESGDAEAIVAYVLSIRQADTRKLTNQQRADQARAAIRQ